MLDFFRKLKEPFDVLFFLPQPDDKDGVYLEAGRYAKRGKELNSTSVGPSWHIILFRNNENGVYDKDEFEAVFSDPREYVSNLIPQDWYGFVARKTTTSKKFVKSAVDKLEDLYYNRQTS